MDILTSFKKYLNANDQKRSNILKFSLKYEKLGKNNKFVLPPDWFWLIQMFFNLQLGLFLDTYPKPFLKGMAVFIC